METFISIIIPNYNGSATIGKCLDAVFASRYGNFEVVVVDDCSTDGSAEVILNYAARDRRVRLIANPKNLGMVENWNLCLAEAKGEYIKYVFADDFLTSPEALQKRIGSSAAACGGMSKMASRQPPARPGRSSACSSPAI